MKPRALFFAAVVAGLGAQVILAASLSHESAVKISGGSDFNLSVYPGKAEYSGLASGVFGDGTAEAYYLIRNEIPPDPIESSGGSVGTAVVYAVNNPLALPYPTYNGGTGFSEFNRGKVWVTSNPGVNFGGSTADYGITNITISGAYQLSGTIDLHEGKFLSGTVYILCGGYDTPFNVDLTMSGSGQTDLVATTGTIDPNPDRNMYVISFPFDRTSSGYDMITYSYEGSANNRSRFMGVVVDAQLPPKGTLITLF